MAMWLGWEEIPRLSNEMICGKGILVNKKNDVKEVMWRWV